MFDRPSIAAAFFAVSTLLTPASAFADGEIQITHAKALAGNVTPGDTPGYPVTISIPGVFELASNLFVAANKIGIQVTSKNVTIDLNGFTLQGSNVAWYGVAGGVNNVTIRNGTIESFKFDGIIGTGAEWIIEDMRVVANGRDGIACANHTRVLNSTISFNLRNGIKCSEGLFEGNLISQNGAVGLEVVVGTALGNHFNFNAGPGIFAAGTFGFGNNTLVFNNGNGGQVSGLVFAIHPNLCGVASC